MLVSASFRRRCFSHRKALNNRITALSSQTHRCFPPPPTQFPSRPISTPPPPPTPPPLPLPSALPLEALSLQVLSRVDTTRPMRFVFAVPYFLGVLFASGCPSRECDVSTDGVSLKMMQTSAPSWATDLSPGSPLIQPPARQAPTGAKPWLHKTVTLEHTRGRARNGDL